MCCAGAGSPAAHSRRLYPEQGKARGVQGAGILRCDHHSATGGAGAAGIGGEAQERAGVRLDRRRAGAEVRRDMEGGEISVPTSFSLDGLPDRMVMKCKMSAERTPES